MSYALTFLAGHVSMMAILIAIAIWQTRGYGSSFTRPNEHKP
jgi:hypothetical protein